MKKLFSLALLMFAAAAYADASLAITIAFNDQDRAQVLVANAQEMQTIKISNELDLDVQIIEEDETTATIKCAIRDNVANEVICEPILKTEWQEPAQFALYGQEESEDNGTTETKQLVAVDIVLIPTKN